LEDLTSIDKIIIKEQSLDIPSHILIDKLKDLPDYAENNFIDELILDNVDMNIKKIQVDNPT